MSEEVTKEPGNVKKLMSLGAIILVLGLSLRACQPKDSQPQTFVVSGSQATAPSPAGTPEQTRERILADNVEARNSYLEEAISSYDKALEQLVSARANYFLEEAKKVQEANGTPVERWLLNTANSINVALERKAGFSGTFTGTAEDQEAVRALLIDGLAIHRAYQEELGLAKPRANQWERVDPAPPALAGTAAIAKGSQVFRSKTATIGLPGPIESPNPEPGGQ